MSYYVRRDKTTGAILGLFTAPQPQPDGSCLTDPDPVPDNDAGVLAFLTAQEAALSKPADPVITQSQLAAALSAAGMQATQVTAALSAASATPA